MAESIFSKKHAAREQKQTRKEKKQSASKDDRKVISISLSVEEIEAVKAYAKENGATVSGLIGKWIRENCL